MNAQDHDPSDGDCPWSGQASLDTLGLLESATHDGFHQHLSEGCSECARELESARLVTAELDQLSVQAGSAPPPGLRQRVLSIPHEQGDDGGHPWRGWHRDPARPFDEGLAAVAAAKATGWEPTAHAGVAVRPLHLDQPRRRVTMLVRMDPGSSYPAHRHAAAEKCFVLEGDLRVGDRLHMHSGDYQVAQAGSLRPIQRTDDGCLLLITSSQDDELVLC